MDRGEVDRWLAGYVEAWRTYDRERIAALFSADAKYRYHPYDGWVRGRDAIVSSWLGESDAEGASTPDQPGTWEAAYRTIAVDGDVVAEARFAASDFASDARRGPVRMLHTRSPRGSEVVGRLGATASANRGCPSAVRS